MKHDDHNFGGDGNLNSGGAEGDSPLPRELQARVVAAVAGEASAFEAAELERLAAENPAVAEFKQRMESVHALAAEAAQPDAQPLRLSAERRAKVLAAIGAMADSAPGDGSAKIVAMEPARKPSLPGRVLRWTFMASAACAAIAALFLVLGPVEEKPTRPDPSRTVLGMAMSESSRVKYQPAAQSAPAADEYRVAMAPVSVDLPVRGESPYAGAVAPTQDLAPTSMIAGSIAVHSPPKIGAGGGTQLFTSSGFGAAGPDVTRTPVEVTFGGPATASNAAAPVSSPPSDIVKMDAFEVSASREGSAMAISSMSAARMPTMPAPVFDLELPTTAGTEKQAQGLAAADRSTLNWGTTGSAAPGTFNIAAADTFNFTQPSGGAVLNRAGVVEGQAKAETNSGTVQLVGGNGAIVIDDPKTDIRTSAGAPLGVTSQNQGTASTNAFTASGAAGDIIDTGLGGVRAAPEVMFGADRIRTIEEGHAAGQQAQAAVALNEGVLTLSPFQVSSDKDTGYAAKATVDRRERDRLASERSPQQELAKKRAEEAKAKAAKNRELNVKIVGEKPMLVLDGSAAKITSSFGAIIDDVDQKKTDAPLARAKAPADESLRLETSTGTQAVSTFSLHVSDVSFRLAQTALARGEMPDPATIRPEEFYNALNYGDPAPAVAEKVGSRIEQSAHPFLAQRNLLRVALKVAATGRTGATPLRLTVLLDTSGSMEREDRAATVRRAMEVLVSLLGPNDRLTLIGFARQPRLLAENLSGDRARDVLDIIARTPADGGTNMEEALKLATQLALRHRDAKAQNRVVMLTDGAANLGNAVPDQLAKRIEELRQRGIAFDACGVGLDGLDDGILEALTRQGDGRYTVLNSPDDAGSGFAQKLAGAFRPAAENVKVQVRFNPARVATYRLIGFEQHRLKEQDFRNDKVDAAELAAEEAGVALYQFEPLPQGEGDVGELFVRFRDPATGAMVERSWAIPYEPRAAAFDRAAPGLQLAGLAGLLAEKLRADTGAAQITLRDFATAMAAMQVRYSNEPRVQELGRMFTQARRLTGQ